MIPRLASRMYARSGALLLESSPERACVLQARSLRSRPRSLADIGRLLSLLQSCATRAALLHAALMLPRALVPLGHQARRQLAHRHRCRRAESAKEPCGSANGGRVQRSAVPGPSGNRSRGVPTEGLCTRGSDLSGSFHSLWACECDAFECMRSNRIARMSRSVCMFEVL